LQLANEYFCFELTAIFFSDRITKKEIIRRKVTKIATIKPAKILLPVEYYLCSQIMFVGSGAGFTLGFYPST
jgi:hypothetical protein